MREDNSLYKGIVIDIDPNTYKVKVRVPSIHGGSKSPNRVLDKDLPYIYSLVGLNSNDIGSIVVCGFEGGSRSNMLILGRIVDSIRPPVEAPVTDVLVNGESVLDGTVAKVTTPTKTSDLTNDSGFVTEAEVNVKRYNGTISTNDWEQVGNRFMYILTKSTHNLSNPMLLDYLVQGNTGYSHGMCNYEVLTNGNILFTSDLNVNVKYVILGE